MNEEELNAHFETLANSENIEDRIDSIKALREQYDQTLALNQNLTENVDTLKERTGHLEEKLHQYANSVALGSRTKKEETPETKKEEQDKALKGFALLRGY